MHLWGLVFGSWSFFLPASLPAQTLRLPDRSPGALSGTEFAKRITPLGLAEREREIVAQINSGNVPTFLRRLCPVQVASVIDGQTNTATFYATPDYLAIGSDEDYFLMPISPNTAQRIADGLQCSLPTRKMVNDIYSAAAVKLAPAPISPSPAMTSVPVFSHHNAIVRDQRAEQLRSHPLGALVAGHQKDVVICVGLANAPGKVAIYGWHQTNGAPIQPLYLQHFASWVDYSQCIRLVQQSLRVNEAARTVAEVLADPAVAGLLSDEGVIAKARYPTNEIAAPDRSSPLPAAPIHISKLNSAIGFDEGAFGERVASFRLEPEVRVQVNAPAAGAFVAGKKVLLVLYALPNGNTIEQTVGKRLAPGDNGHYDIQHIGAQTRFLRETLTNRVVVVAYLEADMKSWPAWRKKYGDKGIPGMVGRVQGIFATNEVETTLSGHSGGGSFIFGYLNAVEQIPDNVERIVFVDSNYAYDRALGHEQKLANWLVSPKSKVQSLDSGPLTPVLSHRMGERGFTNTHYLCVLAYNDAVALLDGKSFVSAAGGTWGRSHAMQADLAQDFTFSSRTNGGFERYSALDGRLQFILKENPERKIFHTVQVERNGFIHGLVSGTRNEGQGYEYFGERAYTKWIGPGPAEPEIRSPSRTGQPTSEIRNQFK